MENRFLLPLLALLPYLSSAQTTAIDRVNPTNWWVGMKNPSVQVLVHGPGAGTLTYSIGYPGVTLLKTNTVENPNYAFLDLVISPMAKPGRVQITGKKGSQTVTRTWEIRARDQAPKGQGVTDADFVYLAMPDRFANGDPGNDKFADLRDPNHDRANPFFRHGGDLAGAAQRFYQALAQDAVYQDPAKLVTFLDNHDHNRFLSEVGDDLDKYKMGLTWLLTTRGIPSLYYGTEILMKNFKDPTDAEVRKDFPGGWPGDQEDKFTPAGRTARENEAFDFVRKLATYRRDHPTLHSGKLMQYLPQDGLYVYFRYDATGTVMVASNTTDKPASLPTARFVERMAGFTKAHNMLTGENLGSLVMLQLPAKTAVVLELLKY